MTSLFASAPPCCELLEPRVLFSGAADLVIAGGFGDSRIMATAVTNGNKALFAGGLVDNGTNFLDTDEITIYDNSTGAMSTAHLSTPHFQNVAVTVAGKSLFVGGYTLGGGVSAAVDIFDGTTGLFTSSRLPHLKLYAIATQADGKALFTGDASSGRTADTFDPVTGQWATIVLPRRVSGLAAAAVSSGTLTLIASAGGANLFDSVTGRWSGTSAPFSRGIDSLSATVAGSKAVFVDDVGRVAMFDFITRRWTTTYVQQRRHGIALAAVGSKVILAGGIVDSTDPSMVGHGVDDVDVFDVLTSKWSAMSLLGPTASLAATSVGRLAIFAFGSVGGTPSNDDSDVFIDTAPCPLFTGSLSGHVGGKARLTLFNTGDADLAGPYTVDLYASADRTLKGAIRIGRQQVNVPLAAGASTSLRIRSASPHVPQGGAYYLLAAVRDSHGNVTPVAASATPFRVPRLAAAWG